MKTFTFTLNVEIEAIDLEQAASIAQEIGRAIVNRAVHPWKIKDVEVDDVEEL